MTFEELLARIDRLVPGVTHPQHLANLKRRRGQLARLAGPARAKAIGETVSWLERRYAGWAQTAGPSAAPSRKERARPSPIGELSAAQADRRAGGRWFVGYATRVPVFAPLRLAGDVELGNVLGPHAIVDGDLRITGRLRPGTGRSIVAVTGDVRAAAIESGEGVLVIRGGARATRYVALLQSEGIVSIGGEQAIDRIVPCIDAPRVLAWDGRPKQRRHRTFVRVKGALVERDFEDANLEAVLARWRA